MNTYHITQAVEILKQGGIVAFPTETVYGLGADANRDSAVRKIFRAKERPFDHPLIVHVADLADIHNWAESISKDALTLAHAFWPGPLTLILKKQAHVLDIVTGGQDTIGLRIPRHPVARALLEAFGGGLAAPSANQFTHISPTTITAVQEELGGRIDLILDGGKCEVGIESTIIDMSGDQPILLRPGVITAKMIANVIGPILSVQQKIPTSRVPGMHAVHYAPMTKTELITRQQIPTLMRALKMEDLPMAFLLYHHLDLPFIEGVHCFIMATDAESYAHDLYHILRSLDHQSFKKIMIERVPDGQEWEAIRDRLRKASTNYIESLL